MAGQELYIDNNLVELTSDVAVPLNFAIADIAEPDKVKSDFSKTIKIPGSATINGIFSYIYDTRIDLTSSSADFDPTVKVDARYEVDSVILLDGYMQLKDINITEDYCIEYEIVLFGKNANIFGDIGEAELDELDMSEYDHAWTMANESDSWETQIQRNGSPVPFAFGEGYVYPFIDYGFNNDENNYDVTHFFPAIYTREYLLKIFEAAGYAWNSTFLDSGFFRGHIIPYNGVSLRISQTQVANRTVEVTATAPASPSVTTATATTTITFDTEVTDPDGQITVPSTTITVGETGVYDLIGELNFTAVFTPSTANTVNSMVVIKAILRTTVNGTVVGSKILYIKADGSFTTSYTTASNPDPITDEYWTDLSGNGLVGVNNIQVPASVIISNRPGYRLTAGDTVQLKCAYQLKYISPYKGDTGVAVGADLFDDDASPGTYYGGTVTLNIEAASFKMLPIPVDLVEGETIEMNNAIPKEIKQKDFFKGIINKYNLYIQPQEDNPTVLDIEPRDDFYGTTVTDWSSKLDTSKGVDIKPLGALDFSEFVFKDKEDNDYYNKLYKDTWVEVYGQRNYVLDNEFLNGKKEITTIFSPTPLVGSNDHDRRVSEIFKSDGSNGKARTESNIRMIYYNALAGTNKAWTHTSSLVADVSRVDYPYAGHLTDPYSPTADLNWGLSKEVYYTDTYIDSDGTINGAVNGYWYNYINEISNVNSKLVTAYFNLNSRDISELDFKNLFYFNGDYFRLQKVIDYNPVNRQLTKCEFIKFAEIVDFTDPTITNNGGSGTISGGLDPVVFPTVPLSNLNNNAG